MKRLSEAIVALILACSPWSSMGQVISTNEPSLRFVFMTDIHTRTDGTRRFALEKAAAAINEQNPDLVVLGPVDRHRRPSIVCGRRAAMGRVPRDAEIDPGSRASRDRESRPRCRLPRRRHADSRGSARNLPREAGRGRDVPLVETNGYHFILLDSIRVVGGNLKYEGWIRPEQLEWLKADLAAVDVKTPIVLVTHLPFLTTFFQDAREPLRTRRRTA